MPPSEWFSIDSSVALDGLKSLILLLFLISVRALAVRWIAGRERADRLAWGVLVLLAVVICAYQVVLWIADPLSFFLGRSV